MQQTLVNIRGSQVTCAFSIVQQLRLVHKVSERILTFENMVERMLSLTVHNLQSSVIRGSSLSLTSFIAMVE